MGNDSGFEDEDDLALASPRLVNLDICNGYLPAIARDTGDSWSLERPVRYTSNSWRYRI